MMSLVLSMKTRSVVPETELVGKYCLHIVASFAFYTANKKEGTTLCKKELHGHGRFSITAV